jgi:hypothetical protein
VTSVGNGNSSPGLVFHPLLPSHRSTLCKSALRRQCQMGCYRLSLKLPNNNSDASQSRREVDITLGVRRTFMPRVVALCYLLYSDSDFTSSICNHMHTNAITITAWYTFSSISMALIANKRPGVPSGSLRDACSPRTLDYIQGPVRPITIGRTEHTGLDHSSPDR